MSFHPRNHGKSDAFHLITFWIISVDIVATSLSESPNENTSSKSELELFTSRDASAFDRKTDVSLPEINNFNVWSSEICRSSGENSKSLKFQRK